MVLIIGIATAAIAAVKAYNRAKDADEQHARHAVTSLRQSTGVVLAIGRAIVAVLDALQLITTSASAIGASGVSIGRRVRDEDFAGV